jgi:ActR/RegA family two-component response regulator
MAAELHRLRSTLARLRAELELAELDAVPPGPETFAALEEALSRVGEIESLTLAGACRVHVLDDDARLAELTATRLRRRGFEVLAGEDIEAMRLQLRPGDRLVVDFGLLTDATESVVRDVLAATRAVVISGSVRQATRERALEMGAAAYLVKPVEIDALVALLRQLPEAAPS